MMMAPTTWPLRKLSVAALLGVPLVASAFGRLPPPPPPSRASSFFLDKRQEDAPPVLTAPLPTGTDNLECFQVAQPVLGPSGPVLADTVRQPQWVGDGSGGLEGEKCEMLLMERVFAWSYGFPFVGEYTPPDCDFNRVIVNFTVTSAGRQFDRLAVMYLGDTEVWRTSTAEPRAAGIIWTYWKDMTHYLSMWQKPQKVIFDLGNLINDLYTGPFNTTLTATFFMAPEDKSLSGAGSEAEAPAATVEPSESEPDQEPESLLVESASVGRRQSDEVAAESTVDGPADVIIPISAHMSNSDDPSSWSIPQTEDGQPETFAINMVSDFPRNARRAVFTVSANGQQAEEFWWSNVPESSVAVFNETAGLYYGLSPWREVQVLIDGRLAGVQWPFPVVFTGGVNPVFHRPVVGIDAFDLREHEIDVTPWLPLLCDGRSHEFRVRVAGIDDTVPGMLITNRTDAGYWVVTGKVFVWLDEDADHVTTGDEPYASGGPDNVMVSINQLVKKGGDNGFNETLEFEVVAERSFSVRGNIVTSKGPQEVRWSQNLHYTNRGNLANYGYDQTNDMVISGTDASYGSSDYRTEYSYPMRVFTAWLEDPDTGDFSINATLYQGLDLRQSGPSVFPSGIEAFPGYRPGDGSSLSTFRDGFAYMWQSGDRKSGYSYGDMAQEFTFGGQPAGGADSPLELLYSRKVAVVNDTVTSDRRYVVGHAEEVHTAEPPPPEAAGGMGTDSIQTAGYAVKMGAGLALASLEGMVPSKDGSLEPMSFSDGAEQLLMAPANAKG